jgi:hypothetical protein
VYDYDVLSKNDFLGQKLIYEVDLLKCVAALDPPPRTADPHDHS